MAVTTRLKTGSEYLDALRAQSPEIYVRGQKVSDRVTHPGFQPTLNTWGKWVYEAAFVPELSELMLAGPSLSGQQCHSFWHIPRTREDLLLNMESARKLAQHAPASGYTSIGRDELASLYAVSWRVDQELGTDYHPRVERYIRRFQEEQVMTAAAVTDPKGNRRLRPADQPNPDSYLHVVQRRSDGIVVRGSKMHTSGGVSSQELVVIPQRAMREADADYAVAFAVPVDTPGLKLIARESEQSHDAETNPISMRDELVETFSIFEDVFVPWERVFLCGEWQYAGDIANTFANVNRQGYLGTDAGKLSLYIGAAQLIAELNGVADAPHVVDKITEMIRLQSLIWSAGITAAVQCSLREPGLAVPDPVMTNAGKTVAMEAHYTCARLLLEIAGGAVVTIPSLEDARSPALAHYFEAYYKGAKGTATDRMRTLRFIRDLAASSYAGWWYVEIIHGSGSPAAEKLQMFREYRLKAAVDLVREFAQVGKLD